MVSVHWSECCATSELLMSISSFDIPVRIILSTPAFAARSSVDGKSGGWYCLARYFPWNSSAVAVTAIFSCQHMVWRLLTASTNISKPQASCCRRRWCCRWQPSKIDILVCHAEVCNVIVELKVTGLSRAMTGSLEWMSIQDNSLPKERSTQRSRSVEQSE